MVAETSMLASRRAVIAAGLIGLFAPPARADARAPDLHLCRRGTRLTVPHPSRPTNVPVGSHRRAFRRATLSNPTPIMIH